MEFASNDVFIDSTWTTAQLAYWCNAEPGVYLMAACFPTYRPLIQHIFQKVKYRFDSSTTKTTTTTSDGLPHDIISKQKASAQVFETRSTNQHLMVRGGSQGLQDSSLNQDGACNTTNRSYAAEKINDEEQATQGMIDNKRVWVQTDVYLDSYPRKYSAR